MKTLPVLKEDVIKSANFIICLAQDQSGNSMYGTLSGKGDLIGGIFDILEATETKLSDIILGDDFGNMD